jgi:hypothetical protein
VPNAPPVALAGPLGTSCAGHWTGSGVQPGYPPWTIDLNVTPETAGSSPEGQCGTIEYPSLGCGGYLTHCGTLASGESSFTEVYTHTNANCSPAGTIRAFCGTTMTWTWEGTGGPVTSSLTRM